MNSELLCILMKVAFCTVLLDLIFSIDSNMNRR